MRRRAYGFALLCAVMLAKDSPGFPQMASHGYASCMTCHVAPGGGGLLTAYGRSLSRELLSQWGREGEEAPLYGMVSAGEQLLWGGDLRTLQYFSRSPLVDVGRFIFMQADLEMGLRIGTFTVVGTIGFQNAMSANHSGGQIFSRKHYLLWNTAENFFVRLGKFDAPYGIRWPDHFMYARRDLGWDEGSESYRAEWSVMQESWEGILSLSAGRPDAPQLGTEKAATMRFAKYLGDSTQLIFSAHFGSKSSGNRLVLGPALALRISSSLMLFTQVDLQKKLGGLGGSNTGILEYFKLNFEALKGLHIFALQEISHLNLQDTQTRKTAFGLGVQWFPRPHLELLVGLRKNTSENPVLGTTDSLMALFHYYL